jgi:hypothetical protein
MVNSFTTKPRVYTDVQHAGFGFLGGKEIKDAGVGNLGLQDRKFLCA